MTAAAASVGIRLLPFVKGPMACCCYCCSWCLQEAAQRLQRLDSSGLSLELLDRLEQVCPLPEELESFQSYLQQQQQQKQQQDRQEVPESVAGGVASSFPPLRDVEAAMLPLARLPAVSSRLRILRFDLLAPKTIQELDDALDLVDKAAEQVRYLLLRGVLLLLLLMFRKVWLMLVSLLLVLSFCVACLGSVGRGVTVHHLLCSCGICRPWL